MYARHWTFRTAHGLWAIARTPDGRWHPMLDDQDLGSYHSPAAALDDLAGGHTTGLVGNLDSSRCGLPDELSGWVRHGRQGPSGG